MSSKCRVLQSGICQITQPYHSQGGGWEYAHWGIDLVDFANGYNALGWITAHSEGTVIGIVTSYTGSYMDGSYGNYVLLQHPNGFATIYAHLAYGTIKVSYGQKVKQGQVLAYMDNTGNSVGGHLHWEVRDRSGAKIDPQRYLNSDLPGMNTNVWLQKWHLYDAKGKMLKGWQKDKGSWYYLDSNGVMYTGWLLDKSYGGWFLLASDGKMLTGWQFVNGKWYYMNDKGLMQTGWLKDGGKWYLLGTDGAMLTGWQKVDGKWYYLTPTKDANHKTGEMWTGWLKYDSEWYYLDPKDGYMYTGTHIIDGKTYYFDNTGKLINK